MAALESSWAQMTSGEHLRQAQLLLGLASREHDKGRSKFPSQPSFDERLADAHLRAAQVQATYELLRYLGDGNLRVQVR